MGSTCRSRLVMCSRSWARAARASRPCSTASPASSAPTRARSISRVGGSTISPTGRGPSCGAPRFGFIFQFGQLIPELSALENVALPLLLNGERRNAATEQAAAWFPRLGLDGLSGRLPGELSGGQAQRVAIARALVIRPSVVFADEPTGSLDSLAGEQVMELLTASTRAEGVAVVLVTHEARVAAYADREIIVRDGRISGAST